MNDQLAIIEEVAEDLIVLAEAFAITGNDLMYKRLTHNRKQLLVSAHEIREQHGREVLERAQQADASYHNTVRAYLAGVGKEFIAGESNEGA